MTRPPKMTFEDRFWSRVSKGDGCWLWTGTQRKDGYGSFHRNGKYLHAHRASWIINFGEIKNKLHVLHKCDVRNCVNPSHLFLGTNHDNILDCVAKGRFRGNGGDKGRNSSKTHCPKGHPYSGENLFISKTNRRECRTCMRARRNAWNRKWRISS